MPTNTADIGPYPDDYEVIADPEWGLNDQYMV